MPAASSHILPFQVRGVTAQPLYSFFQELELAAPIKCVMWAARLRPEPVAGCLACFFWPSWKLGSIWRAGERSCTNLVVRLMDTTIICFAVIQKSRQKTQHPVYSTPGRGDRFCDWITIKEFAVSTTCGHVFFSHIPKHTPHFLRLSL